jgi:hypothetical protein
MSCVCGISSILLAVLYNDGSYYIHSSGENFAFIFTFCIYFIILSPFFIFLSAFFPFLSHFPPFLFFPPDVMDKYPSLLGESGGGIDPISQ